VAEVGRHRPSWIGIIFRGSVRDAVYGAAVRTGAAAKRYALRTILAVTAIATRSAFR